MHLNEIIKDLCCEPMSLLIADIDSPLTYKPWIRAYSLEMPLRYSRKKNKIYANFSIYYCPRCATKLPENLDTVWSKIIKEKYGITNTSDKNQFNSLPSELKTDEWWKKRGL